MSSEDLPNESESLFFGPSLDIKQKRDISTKLIFGKYQIEVIFLRHFYDVRNESDTDELMLMKRSSTKLLLESTFFPSLVDLMFEHTHSTAHVELCTKDFNDIINARRVRVY